MTDGPNKLEIFQTEIKINGKTYASVDDVPEGFRYLLDMIPPEHRHLIPGLSQTGGDRSSTSPSSLSLSEPPRKLTPAMHAYATLGTWRASAIDVLPFLLIFSVPVFISVYQRSQNSSWYDTGKTDFGIWLGMYILGPLIFFFGFKLVNSLKSGAKTAVLKHGRVCTAQVLSNQINWGSQVNQVPQTNIEYVVDNVHQRISVYGGPLANLPVGNVEVLYHPQYPKALVSLSHLQNELAQAKQRTQYVSGATPVQQFIDKLDRMAKFINPIVWISVILLAIALQQGWVQVPERWLPPHWIRR